MCDNLPEPVVDRRRFLWASGATALVAASGRLTGRASAQASTEVAPDLHIIPRREWGGDLAPQGPLEPEAPEDVRFLLVHHTASGNDYGPDATIGQLRSFYGLHTGDKGWADVAYNFFVDRHGQVFEGRTGSLTAPIKADATGGSQGYALLACFVGDHTAELPTLAATASMIRLLAWMGETYGIDTAPGATVEFVSRGSNLHPAGTTVVTPTIAGHRDMSQTACPGDALYPRVRGEFAQAVTRRRAELAAPPTTVPPTSAPTTSTAAPTSAPGSATSVLAVGDRSRDADGGSSSNLPLTGGLSAALAATLGFLLVRLRRERDDS